LEKSKDFTQREQRRGGEKSETDRGVYRGGAEDAGKNWERSQECGHATQRYVGLNHLSNRGLLEFR
jgi:hypothetical protein